MMNAAQICILIMGGAAIWLIGRQNRRVRRWGYVVGLLSQPFWLYAAWQAAQWGILALSLWYVYAWADGIINHWRIPS